MHALKPFVLALACLALNFLALNFLALNFLALACLPAAAQAAAEPMEISKLVQDLDNRDPGLDGRTPVLLVHGLDGTSDDVFNSISGAGVQEKKGFAQFLDWAYDSGLAEDFIFYRFHYLSNKLPVTELAAGLRAWVDELTALGELPEGQLLIVAHSMGGLVSREFMAHQTLTQGEYADKPAHKRVMRCITLGTPHHGSPAANDTARHIDDDSYDRLLELIDDTYWGDVDVDEPNRSDLRWDGVVELPEDAPGYDDASEFNSWLEELNDNPDSRDKLVAYVGSTSGTDYPLHELRDLLIDSTAAFFGGLYAACELHGFLPAEDDNPVLYPFRGPYDDRKDFDVHVQYCFLAVLLGKLSQLDNDALVPEPSASLQGLLRASYVRRFPGYDHDHLKSGMPDSDDLFTTVAEDLRGAVPPDDPGSGETTDWDGSGGCALHPGAATSGGAGLVLVLALGLALAAARRRP